MIRAGLAALSVVAALPAGAQAASAPAAPAVADAILNQFVKNGCLSSSADLPDYKRLRAVIGVRFGQDGRFLEPPTLIDPPTLPSDDPTLEVFIRRALAGFDKCNTRGFKIPPSYFAKHPPQVVEFEFRASTKD
jgi:hypothetical protein